MADYPEQPKHDGSDEGIVHIIKYTLPQHQEDLDVHLKAWKYRGAIEDLKDWIRILRKHSDVQTLTLDEVADKINQVCDDNEVYLW